MAADLSLLKSFVDGQGAGAGTYTGYAADLDSNFAALETTVNQINQEIAAFGGANATLVLDLIQSSTPTITDGRVGSESFPATFQSADTQISVGVGVALTTAQRLETGSAFVLTGSGASGTRWVALNSDRTITLETSASQGVLDLYSVTWDGAQFTTATLARLDDILVDGDDFQNCLIVAGDAEGNDEAGLPAKTYERIANVLEDIQNILVGRTAGSEGDTLGRIAIAGSAALPGIVLTDGSSVVDETSGIYRQGADSIGFSTGGAEAMRLDANGLRTSPTQGRASATRTSAQTISNTTSTNVLLTTAEQYDVGGYHDLVTNADRMTVPTGYGGLYQVTAFGRFATNGTGRRRLDITVNGTVVSGVAYAAPGAANARMSASVDVVLSAGDIVRMAVEQNSGGNLDLLEARLTVRLCE